MRLIQNNLEFQRRLQESEDALTAELNRRELAERYLEDVQRECKTPFIVPSLLKAFINISKLSYLDTTDTSASLANER